LYAFWTFATLRYVFIECDPINNIKTWKICIERFQFIASPNDKISLAPHMVWSRGWSGDKGKAKVLTAHSRYKFPVVQHNQQDVHIGKSTSGTEQQSRVPGVDDQKQLLVITVPNIVNNCRIICQYQIKSSGRQGIRIDLVQKFNIDWNKSEKHGTTDRENRLRNLGIV